MQGLLAKFAVAALAAMLIHSESEHSNAQRANAQLLLSHQLDTFSVANSPAFSQVLVEQEQAREPINIKYENGELTIDTLNAPLDDILRAICRQTGALIPIPENANERVTTQLGPGRLIVVLGALLNDTNFNYLIEELGPDQSAPVRASLTLKGSGLDTTATPVMSAEMVERQAEQAVAQQKALSERSALLRQINKEHLQFVHEVMDAQQAEGAIIR